jgi:hypothetical protein
MRPGASARAIGRDTAETAAISGSGVTPAAEHKTYRMSCALSLRIRYWPARIDACPQPRRGLRKSRARTTFQPSADPTMGKGTIS